MEIIYLLIGLVVGFIIAYLFLKSKKTIPIEEVNRLNEEINSLKVEVGKYSERIKLLESDKTSLQSDLKSEREKSEKLTSENSFLKSDYSNLQTKLSEQKAEIEELQQKFTKEFENLANKIFKEKTDEFSKQSKTNLDILLNPLNQKIKDFEKKVEETYDKESKERFSLAKEIKGLQELNMKMSKDATDLTNALKGDSKVMGNWGEIVLESILEKSGLVRDREYFVQESHVSADGKRLQPDVIVKLPENKNIIIDSKVSIVAYDKYCSSKNEDDREVELKKHINSIRNHVSELSTKNYQQIYDLEGLDFVIMFVPIEPAYNIAAQMDWEFFSSAPEKNIIILSPSNLLIALKTIAFLWRREFQNRNALEIARQAGSLYDKFVNFYNDLLDVGKKMDSAKDSYENAMKKIHDGRGNLISGVEKIKELGAKASKSLPPAAINRVDIDSDTNLLDN
jgi:DNA recombination protein RmuC